MDQKENTARCELKVAQQLLAAVPALDGKTITADPLHCQKETARIILEKGGDYLLQIKANQPALLETARTVTRGSPLLSRPPADTGASKNARW
jgi:predicted transposase YbfD/YdcC